MTTEQIRETLDQLEANECARQRGINHTRATLEAWDEMTDDEKREGIETALDRLENPW